MKLFFGNLSWFQQIAESILLFRHDETGAEFCPTRKNAAYVTSDF